MVHTYSSLRNRPLESFLLLLTIAFGVALSGLVLSAAWPGLQTGNNLTPSLGIRELSVKNRAQDWGQFYATPNVPPVVRIGRVGDKPVTIEEADLNRLMSEVPAMKVAYLNEESNMGDWSKNRTVGMVSSGYFVALGATLLKGALPNSKDYKLRRPVVVLTEYGAHVLFPKSPALGQSIAGFQVIGLLRVPQGDQYQFRSTQNPEHGPLGLIPYGARVKEGNFDYLPSPLSTLRFLPQPGHDTEALEQLGRAAQKRWGDQVSVSGNAQRSAEFAKAFRLSTLTLALLGVGGLLVASLSILSLMLARVLARQRQLGMAAALGASRARLRSEYLLEVLVLGGLGSILGGLMAFGLLLWLTHDAGEVIGLSLGLYPQALITTVLVATLLSVLFGLVPAIQASRVRPAEALRA